jgi:hypothetical protein
MESKALALDELSTTKLRYGTALIQVVIERIKPKYWHDLIHYYNELKVSGANLCRMRR